jgi:uncharacterized protein (TIGR02145 family)
VATSGQLDFETTPSYTLNVEITKADTTTQSANITINVTNVNEGAAMAISDQTRSIAENSANATNVGAVLTTTGSPTGFSISSGNTNSAFAISSAGQITVATSGQLDFETTPSYTLNVEITKADTTTQSANITINVTDVFELAAVAIGTQTWSASNVSLVPSAGTYVTTYQGSGGDTNDNDGYYYNWEAANNVCPVGWRLPSDDEWKILETNLGMDSDDIVKAGWRATATGTELVGGSSGFDAKLAGSSSSSRGTLGYFWTSTAKSTNDGWRRIISSSAQLDRSGGGKTNMYSDRCLKD